MSKMKRRDFLGVVVKAVGAAGLVKTYGGAPFAFAQTDKVLTNPTVGIWEDDHIIVNRNSGVAHWPHPKLYQHRYRVAPQNAVTVEVDDWMQTIGIEPGVSFNKDQSGKIYEHLALREIEIEDEENITFNSDSLGNSIEVLKLAVSEPGNSNNWRLYELMGRLVSFKNEDDPEAARTEFIEIIEASKISADWKTKDPLARAQDRDKFAKWHAKTVDTEYGDHRKKLYTRVQSSKEL